MDRNYVWVAQRSGQQFYLDPGAEYGKRVGPIVTDAAEIGAALARVCRFSGHSDMTVAEHSVMLSRLPGLKSPVDKMYGLLHDAAEAFGFGDINGPLKKVAFPFVRELQREVTERVWDALVGRYVHPYAVELVDTMDKHLGTWERHWSFPAPLAGPKPEGWRSTQLPDGVHALYLGRDAAERLFTDRYAELAQWIARS